MSELFSLWEFLDDNDGYTNDYGVVFDLLDEGEIYLGSTFHESKASDVISVDVGNVFEESLFLRLFRVRCSKDLNAVTYTQLMRLYHAGIMEVTCLVDERHLGGSLVFKKTVEGLFQSLPLLVGKVYHRHR